MSPPLLGAALYRCGRCHATPIRHDLAGGCVWQRDEEVRTGCSVQTINPGGVAMHLCAWCKS